MFEKKRVTESPGQPKSAFDEANEWEASRTEGIEKSERRAWRVAFCAIFVAIIAVAAVAMMVPLKETVPYLVRVDNTTGVPDLVSVMTTKNVTGIEVMDKYWLANYVRARENYDWYTLQHDYDTVRLMSAQNVGQGYAKQFEGPDALDKKNGKTVRTTISIISVVPTGPNTGTIRFIKTTKRVEEEGQPGTGTTTKWIATVGFEYVNAPTKESDRQVNPVGFQVLSYRVDPEMAEGAQ